MNTDKTTVLTPKEESALFLRYQVTVEGKKTPGEIPIHIRLPFFLSRYFRGHTVGGLSFSISDEAILRNFNAILKQKIYEEINLQHAAIYMSNICPIVEELPAEELARRIDENDKKCLAQLDRRYEAVINEMSSSGRELLLTYIERNITPSFSTTDIVALAKEEPEFYRQSVREECEWKRKGEEVAREATPAIVVESLRCDSYSGNAMGSLSSASSKDRI